MDNSSKFRVIRHDNSGLFNYREEALVGEIKTEIYRALIELGNFILSHEPENARVKGEDGEGLSVYLRVIYPGVYCYYPGGSGLPII